MLEAQAATIALGGVPVLREASVSLGGGELVAVVGANGAGKSTLLRLLSGEIAPRSGHARLDGRPLGSFRPAALARRRAVMPQASRPAFGFTAAEIVSFGAEAGGARPGEVGGLARAMLERVGLAPLADRPVATLSGGQAQRVHLARALAQVRAMGRAGGTRYLLLDEPTASLDLRHQLGTLAIAREAAGQGVGVLAILHDLNLAVHAATRIVALAGGRVVADGPPRAVVDERFVETVYGLRLPVGRPPPPGTPFLLPQSEGLPPQAEASEGAAYSAASRAGAAPAGT